MDRLSTLTTLRPGTEPPGAPWLPRDGSARVAALALACALASVLGSGACDSKADKPAPAPASRTDGAKVSTGQAASTEAFCDLHATDSKAAVFRWPELAAGGTAPGPPKTWRWVNVWATWCKPCIEEMPRLAAWRQKLAAAGKPVELAFVSVDDSDADVAAYRAAHPDTPPSIRIAGADKRAAWLKGFGLDDGAIPIHLFVSPANRLRCARAGGIRDKDYDVIEQLLGE